MITSSLNLANAMDLLVLFMRNAFNNGYKTKSPWKVLGLVKCIFGNKFVVRYVNSFTFEK